MHHVTVQIRYIYLYNKNTLQKHIIYMYIKTTLQKHNKNFFILHLPVKLIR